MTLSYNKLRGYKYKVALPYIVAIPELSTFVVTTPWFSLIGGTLIVNPGYQWDGASGPTIDTTSTIAASLVHDVLYQMIRAGCIKNSERIFADFIFYRLMRGTENSTALWRELRALYFFIAVRLFGSSSTHRTRVEKFDIIYSV